MKLKAILIAGALTLCQLLQAGDKVPQTGVTPSERQNAAGRVELQIGWGDMAFESLVWHGKKEPVGLLPEHQLVSVSERYRYTQHWFARAGYNVTKWLNVGGMIDWGGVYWDDVLYTGTGNVLAKNGNRCFHNISIMPTVSFNYFNHRYVSFHSGLGVGLNINTGTELDFRGRKTACSPAVYINFFGVKAGYGRFYGTVDLGGMFALKDKFEIYLAGSRLVSVGIGITL